jgi:hypothetical protein
MAASYPSSAKTFTTIANGDDSDAAQINAAYDEITAVEQALLNGLAHGLKPSSTNAYDLGTSLLEWRDLHLKRAASIGGAVALGSTLGVAGLATFAAGALLNGGPWRLADDAVYAPSAYGAGSQNDVAVPAAAVLFLAASSDATSTTAITGIAARTGYDALLVSNKSANRITLKHQSASSVAANRITAPGLADLVLDPGDGCILFYDLGSGYWRTFGYRTGTAGA